MRSNVERIMKQIQDSADSMMFVQSDVFDGIPKVANPMSIMKTDIYKDNDGNYIVEIDVPGIKKEDIKVSILDGELNVSAERHVKEDRNYLLNERKCSVNRTFKLNESVTKNDISAHVDNGVLTIKVNKKVVSTDSREYINID